MPHVGQNARDVGDGAGDSGIGLHAHERVGRPADLESRRFPPDERGVGLRGLRDDGRVARLRHREAIEHGRGVAHAFHLHEILGETVAELVQHRAVRDASARRLEADAATVTRRNADRAADVRTVRNRNDAGDHRGHSASRRSSRRVARPPRRAGVAVERALGRAGHRVFGRRRAAEDIRA